MKNPDVILPPDYLLYESFQLNYHKYFTESKDTAQWLVNHFRRFSDLNEKNVLDWGCGPGRIIRHLPSLMDSNCRFYATDYNSKTIKWCKDHLKGISFNCNTLEAKLPYNESFFDFIYGISIFTHLSESLHYEWFDELYRVLKPSGIMLLTTQGENFRKKLTKPELRSFDSGKLVVRGRVKEGHRTFSAFHPEGFIRNLFKNAEILDFIVQKPEGKFIPQDVWIIRKKII